MLDLMQLLLPFSFFLFPWMINSFELKLSATEKQIARTSFLLVIVCPLKLLYQGEGSSELNRLIPLLHFSAVPSCNSCAILKQNVHIKIWNLPINWILSSFFSIMFYIFFYRNYVYLVFDYYTFLFSASPLGES